MCGRADPFHRVCRALPADSMHDATVPAPGCNKKRKYDALDIERQGRLCFLVKVPKPVMRAWCDPSRGRSELLGRAVISTTEGSTGRRTEITLPDGMCPDAPRSYELDFSADCTSMRVFSVRGEGPSASAALEGCVEQSGHMRPIRGLGYRRQLRGRLRDQFVNAKRTAEYEDVAGLAGAFAMGETPQKAARRRAAATISTALDPRAISRKEMRSRRREERKRAEMRALDRKLEVAGIDTGSARIDTEDASAGLVGLSRRRGKVPKRPKLEEEELRTAIFKHFAVKPRWRVRDMNHSLGQPMSWLKRGITEVATYHRSGPHKGTYELKEEFKMAATE